MRTRHVSRLLMVLALGIVALLALTACKDDKENGSAETPTTAAQTPTVSPQVTIDVSQVPELSDGMLTVGSDIAYPPIESYEEGTQNAVGMDIDLMKAIAALLGVDVEFQQVASFAGIVGDLQASRYDAVMSAISITGERSAQINLIPYFGPVGTGILVQAGNPEGIAGPEDLCGKKVSAQDGTYQVQQINGVEGDPTQPGLNGSTCAGNPITLTTFPDNPTAVQELVLGRVVAELADDPVAQYSAAQSEGNLVELASTRFEAAPYGIGVRKDSTQLEAVLRAALQQIMDNGTYLQILQTWDQEQFALQP